MLKPSLKIEHALYLRLLDQAHAVATYHQDLIANDLAPGDDDRDAMERAADHVAWLAGYRGSDANTISDMLWRGLRDKTKQRQGSDR